MPFRNTWGQNQSVPEYRSQLNAIANRPTDTGGVSAQAQAVAQQMDAVQRIGGHIEGFAESMYKEKQRREFLEYKNALTEKFRQTEIEAKQLTGRDAKDLYSKVQKHVQQGREEFQKQFDTNSWIPRHMREEMFNAENEQFNTRMAAYQVQQDHVATIQIENETLNNIVDRAAENIAVALNSGNDDLINKQFISVVGTALGVSSDKARNGEYARRAIIEQAEAMAATNGRAGLGWWMRNKNKLQGVLGRTFADVDRIMMSLEENFSKGAINASMDKILKERYDAFERLMTASADSYKDMSGHIPAHVKQFLMLCVARTKENLQGLPVQEQLAALTTENTSLMMRTLALVQNRSSEISKILQNTQGLTDDKSMAQINELLRPLDIAVDLLALPNQSSRGNEQQMLASQIYNNNAIFIDKKGKIVDFNVPIGTTDEMFKYINRMVKEHDLIMTHANPNMHGHTPYSRSTSNELSQTQMTTLNKGGRVQVK